MTTPKNDLGTVRIAALVVTRALGEVARTPDPVGSTRSMAGRA